MAKITILFGSLAAWIFLSFTAVPFFITILMYRYFLSIFVPFINSKIAKIIPPRSAMFKSTDSTKDYNVAILFGVEDHVKLEELRRKFEFQVIQRKDSKDNLLRPELQQFPIAICGYYFWKWEQTFSIENHIGLLEIDSIWDQKTKNAQDILEVVEEKVLRTPWTKGESPWEILVVQNFKDSPIYGHDQKSCYSGTVLILRFDHILGDGNSFREIVQDLFSYHEKLDSADMNVSEKFRTPEKFKSGFGSIFFGPHYAHKLLGRLKSANPGYLLDSPRSKVLSNKSNLAVTPTIPLEVIKRVRKSQQVTYTAVILTLVIRSYVRFAAAAGHGVPEKLVCASTRGVAGHPKIKMRNHHTLLAIEISMNTSGSELFKKVDAFLLEQINSTNPHSMFRCTGLLGSLCNCVRDNSAEIFSDGVLIFTNSPFSEHNISLEKGANRLRTVFGVGTIQSGGAGFACLSSSCKDGVRLVLSLDENIISKEEASAKVFAQFFMEELESWSGGNAV